MYYSGAAAVAQLPPTGSAQTGYHYISAGGNDSNTGLSDSQAWKTIGKVNAVSHSSGDIFAFRGGDTFSDATLTPKQDGTTFTSYGTGRATISRSAADGIHFSNLNNILIKNLNIVGSGGTTTVGLNAIYGPSGSYSNLTIDGMNVSGFASDGIRVDCSSGGIVANVAIQNCVATDCSKVDTTSGGGSRNIGVGGITLYGVYGSNNTGIYQLKNVLIERCVSYLNPGAGSHSTVTAWTGSGIYISEADGCLITDCVAHDNGSNNGVIGIWSGDSNNVVIQYCESYNNLTTAGFADGGGFDLDGGCTNCVIQYCYSHHNMGSGYQIFSYDDPPFIVGNNNNIIRFCVSEGDCLSAGNTGQGGILVCANDLTAGCTNNQVYGNTVYHDSTQLGCGAIVVFCGGAALSGTISNNIFYSGANNATLAINPNPTEGTMVLTGNDYFAVTNFVIVWHAVNVYTSYASWQAATGQEKIASVDVGHTNNPGLANPGSGGTISTGSYVTASMLRALAAYTINNTSPMYRAGLNLTTTYSYAMPANDFYSNSISPNILSVGADCPA